MQTWAPYKFKKGMNIWPQPDGQQIIMQTDSGVGCVVSSPILIRVNSF